MKWDIRKSKLAAVLNALAAVITIGTWFLALLSPKVRAQLLAPVMVPVWLIIGVLAVMLLGLGWVVLLVVNAMSNEQEALRDELVETQDDLTAARRDLEGASRAVQANADAAQEVTRLQGELEVRASLENQVLGILMSGEERDLDSLMRLTGLRGNEDGMGRLTAAIAALGDKVESAGTTNSGKYRFKR